MQQISQWANRNVQLTITLSVVISSILIISGIIEGLILKAYGFHIPSISVWFAGSIVLFLLFSRICRKNRDRQKKSLNHRYWERRLKYLTIYVLLAFLGASVGSSVFEEDNYTVFDEILVEEEFDISSKDWSTAVVYSSFDKPIEKVKKKKARKKSKRLKRKGLKTIKNILGKDPPWGVFLFFAILCFAMAVVLAVFTCWAFCTSLPTFGTFALIFLAGSLAGGVFLLVYAIKKRKKRFSNAKDTKLFFPKFLLWIGIVLVAIGVVAIIMGIIIASLYPIIIGAILFLLGLIMSLVYVAKANNAS